MDALNLFSILHMSSLKNVNLIQVTSNDEINNLNWSKQTSLTHSIIVILKMDIIAAYGGPS